MIRRIGGVWLAGILLCTAATAAVEEWAPADTMALVQARNAQQLQERVKQLPMVRLWQEPAVAQFTDNMRKEVQKKMEEFRKEAGFAPEDLLGLVQGEATVLVLPEKTGVTGKPQVVFVGDVGDRKAKVDELIAAATGKLEAGTFDRTEEVFRGKTLVLLRFRDKDANADGPGGGDAPGGDPAARAPKAEPGELAYCHAGNLFLGASQKATLERVLVAMDEKGDETLAKSSDFQRVTGKLDKDADLLVYVNAASILNVMRVRMAADAPNPEAQAAQQKTVTALGLDGVRAFGMNVSMAPEGVRGKWFLFAPEPRKGVVSMLMPAPGELLPPAWVGENAIQYFATTVSVNDVWRETKALLMAEWPAAWNMVQTQMQGLEQRSQGKLNVERDIIGNLGVGFTMVTMESAKEPMGQKVAVLGLRDRAAFEKGMREMAALFPIFKMNPVEYLGHTIQEVTPAPPPIRQAPDGADPEAAEPEGAPKAVSAWCASPVGLLIGGNANVLRSVLRRVGGEGPALRDRKEFTALAARAPRQVVMMSYGDDAAKICAFLKTLKQDGGGSTPPELQMLGLDKYLNLQAIPEEALIRKYLTRTLSWMTVAEDGLAGESFTPAAEEAK